MVNEICFSVSEICFVLSNSFALAGLIMASISSVKGNEKTIVNQSYNTLFFFHTKEKDGHNKAVNIPKKNIARNAKERYEQSVGLFFAAIGIAIPILFDSSRPRGLKSALTFILTIIVYAMGVGLTNILTRWKTRRIINKIEEGCLEPDEGYRMNIRREETEENENC